MDSRGPMERARIIVDEYQSAFGSISRPEKMIEAVGILLGFSQLATTPHTRDIPAGPSDEQCAVVCMIVSNPQGSFRQDGDGWQKRVNDVIRSLRDERNALRAAVSAGQIAGQSDNQKESTT